jgi:hypothetical protein
VTDYIPFPAKGFSQEAKALIREYESYGWEFEASQSNHAIGRAPDGVTTCSVGQRITKANRSQQNSEAPLKAWKRRLAEAQPPSLVELSKPIFQATREGWHPSRVADVAASIALGWEPEQMVNGAIRLTRSGSTAIVVRKSDRPMTKAEHLDVFHRAVKGGDPMIGAMAARMSQEEWAEYVMDVFSDIDLRTRVRVVPSTTPSDDLPGEHLRVTPPDVSLASDSTVAPAEERRPWTARRGGRRTYESKAVVEVLVDGVPVAYECSRCDTVGEDPHFIAAHYRRAHRFRKGREEQNPDIPEASEYHPSERLIRALMEFLDSHTPPGWTTGDEDATRYLAVTALRWMGTRPDLPPPGPVVPLTDAQIVERIRRLVGAEDHLEEVETLTEEVERLEARAADLEGFLAAADARADRLQSDLDTWLSLAPRPASG